MRNVLIIASLYGSKRVLGLAKYLPEFNWRPTIITPPVSWQPTIISGSMDRNGLPFEVIETEYRDRVRVMQSMLRTSGIEESRRKVGRVLTAPLTDRLFHLGGMIVNYPDSFAGWGKYAAEAAQRQIAEQGADALISICPVTSHVVAGRLKKEYNLPWVSDMPDLWSANHNYAYGRVRKLLDRRLEQQTLAGADVLTTSSEPRAEQLRKIHASKPVHSITLGFDHRKYRGLSTLTEKFTITYTGIVYEGRQNPEVVLKALAWLRDRAQHLNGHRNSNFELGDFEVRFYGDHVSGLDDLATKLGLDGVVKQYGVVSQQEAILAQMESQVLLLLDWEDKKELGVFPGKVFEYIGARRPILATGGSSEGVVAKLLEETGVGGHAVGWKDAAGYISKWYNEYKMRGEVGYSVGSGITDRFTQLEVAREYAGLLDGLCEEVDR